MPCPYFTDYNYKHNLSSFVHCSFEQLPKTILNEIFEMRIILNEFQNLNCDLKSVIYRVAWHASKLSTSLKM